MANCGACGQSCFGGTCTGGKCQPSLVATVVQDFLVSSDTIYYFTQTSTGSQLSKVSANAASGTPPTVLATITGESCEGLAIDEGSRDIFFVCAMDLNHFIHRLPSGKSESRIVTFGQYQNPHLLPLGGMLYWWEQTNPTQIGLSSADGKTTVGTLVTVGGVIDVVAKDNTNIFMWWDLKHLQQVNTSKMQASELWTNNVNASVSALVSDGSSVYFDDAGVGLWRVPKDVSSTVATKVVSAANVVTFGAVDATNIYFATRVASSTGSGCASYQLLRTSKAGGIEPIGVYSGTNACPQKIGGGDKVLVWMETPNSCSGSTCFTSTLYKLAK